MSRMQRDKGARVVSEAALHKAVADFLNVALLPPTWWTTFPLGGGGYVRGAQLRARGAKKGTPDILIIHDGKAHWIELKAPKGRLSDAQEQTLVDLATAGCAGVWLARNIPDVVAALTCWRIPTRARAA